MAKTNTQPTDPQCSSLDELRTVEFRQVVRGYSTNEVDGFLERVAMEAAALQAQNDQSSHRLSQAADRVAELELEVRELQNVQSSGVVLAAAARDEKLQRMLISAQEFVDQTQAEAETQATVQVAEAEVRARSLVREAEERARSLAEEAERRLGAEIARLEAIRTHLVDDVAAIAHRIEDEHLRLRSALGEMLNWVDEHVRPAPSLLAPPSDSDHRLNGNGSIIRPVAGTKDVLTAAAPLPIEESQPDASLNESVGAAS